MKRLSVLLLLVGTWIECGVVVLGDVKMDDANQAVTGSMAPPGSMRRAMTELASRALAIST